ncbi:MAG: hypothetical protein ACXAEX_02075 [Promethearchaeota archaeon]|jgi:hypothetical protein
MSKRNIIFALSIFLMIGLTWASLNAEASAPMHLDLSYDPEDPDTLEISFVHGVTDPHYHYVSRVEIDINHSHSPTVFTYTSQPTPNIFTYTYPDIVPGFNVSAGFNATIEVTAYSTRGSTVDGVYSKEMHVGVWHWEPKGSFSSVVGPTVISTVLVIGIVMLPWINSKIKRRK